MGKNTGEYIKEGDVMSEMGDKSNTDSLADVYVDGSTSFAAVADSSDSDKSDDEKEHTKGKKEVEKEEPYKASLQSILIIVNLLATKKRAEFPTTMDKEKRGANSSS